MYSFEVIITYEQYVLHVLCVLHVLHVLCVLHVVHYCMYYMYCMYWYISSNHHHFCVPVRIKWPPDDMLLL